MSKQPDIKLKSNISFGIQLAGWVGEKGTSFKLTKRYKDKNSGEWKDTEWLSPQDLAGLSFLIPEAIAQAQQHEQLNKGEKHGTYIQASTGGESQASQSAPSPIATTTFTDDDIPF